jgi:phage terminase small subunit
LVENVERAMQAAPVLDAKGNPTGEYRYNGGVANRALELIGKENGMFVDRKEVGGPGAFAELNDEELQQAIIEQTRELAELDPEFAEFAKQLGQQKCTTKH